MSEDFASTTFGDGPAHATASASMRINVHWGVVLAGGVVAMALGAALAAWPGETVAVLAWLLGFQLLVAGFVQVVLGLVGGEGITRWAVAVGGVISIGIGLCFFFSPLQTLTFVGWAAGFCVLAIGVADLLTALLTRTSRHRIWQGIRGALGVVAGGFLIANPDWSLGAMVVIACVWLIAYGFITIIAALVLRSEQRSAAA